MAVPDAMNTNYRLSQITTKLFRKKIYSPVNQSNVRKETEKPDKKF
jgi:hypothetical protein